jgi:hypothetical protein
MIFIIISDLMIGWKIVLAFSNRSLSQKEDDYSSANFVHKYFIKRIVIFI